MRPSVTWILIADGGRARVLSQVRPGEKLEEVAGLRFEADLKMAREMGTDRPGRSHESIGSARHSIEPHSDPHRLMKKAFVADVADAVARRLASGEFDRLVVVAPPAVLGDLRGSLADSVRKVIIAEVAKDLTKTPDREVASHLADAVRL